MKRWLHILIAVWFALQGIATHAHVTGEQLHQAVHHAYPQEQADHAPGGYTSADTLDHEGHCALLACAHVLALEIQPGAGLVTEPPAPLFGVDHVPAGLLLPDRIERPKWSSATPDVASPRGPAAS